MAIKLYKNTLTYIDQAKCVQSRPPFGTNTNMPDNTDNYTCVLLQYKIYLPNQRLQSIIIDDKQKNNYN